MATSENLMGATFGELTYLPAASPVLHSASQESNSAKMMSATSFLKLFDWLPNLSPEQ
jgi:hypothetical protein